LENEVLGFYRQGDIPGSEVPERYFAWLRTRDARFVADVFEHNRLDVISLAVLTAHLAELLAKGPAAADLRSGRCDRRGPVVAGKRRRIERGRHVDALAGRTGRGIGWPAGRLLSLYR
jgi:hypothetical protein